METETYSAAQTLAFREAPPDRWIVKVAGDATSTELFRASWLILTDAVRLWFRERRG